VAFGYHRAVLDDPPPFRRHAIRVSGGHVLHDQESGSEAGILALVLHGGPGSGCSPVLRRIFDPQRYRIVCIDQRGAGCNTQHTRWTLPRAA
jgi:proline iminopeptidase